MYKRSNFISNVHFIVICGLEVGVIKNNELVPKFHKFYMEIDKRMLSNTCLKVLPRDIEFDFDWTALIILLCKIYPLNGVLYSDTAMSTHSVRYVKVYLCVCSNNKNLEI